MNHLVPLSEAIAMTSLYRTQREAILKPEFQGRAVLPLSESFDRSVFDSLLSQAGCVGIRIYYGMDEKDLVHAIVVGYDAAGKDLLPSQNKTDAVAGEEDVVAENSNRCPDLCPPPSPLNS